MDGFEQPAAAGWYPDPHAPGQERLWDGSDWLDLTRPHDPGRVESNPAGWRPDPNNSTYQRLWSGDEWTERRRANPEQPAGDKTYPDSSAPRALGGLGMAAIVFLALTICANVAVLITNQRYIGYESELINGTNPGFNRVNDALGATKSASGAYLIATLLAAAFFIAWFYRAYRNLPRRGMSDLRFGPGWAIGSWFVPILALIRPKQIANDVWRGSTAQASPMSSWRDRTVDPLVHWWWGLWVGGSVISTVGARAVDNANSDLSAATVRSTLESERTGLYVDQVASLLLIVAAVFAIVLIRRVSGMQDGDQPSAAPQGLVSTPPPA